ncbi:unnamed protein product [Cuscuta campestris]|uniref:Uncharacterized protein n=1 Tax=Cuscuta campestris TaxID=132261 RepID=A0A484M202_9ASTE|nr:unnamed protein product [Cuscuta campestris]
MHEIILCLEVRKLPANLEFRKDVVPVILSNEFQRFKGMVFPKSRRMEDSVCVYFGDAFKGIKVMEEKEDGRCLGP